MALQTTGVDMPTTTPDEGFASTEIRPWMAGVELLVELLLIDHQSSQVSMA